MTHRAIGIVRAATGVFAALLAVVSLLPAGRGPGGWDSHIHPALQNSLHVPSYAILLVGLAMSVAPGRRSAGGALLLAAVLSAAYGGVLEAFQAFVPGRTAAVDDALLNVAGIALAMPVAWWLTRRLLARQAAELEQAKRPT